jgi:hypothetical protein
MASVGVALSAARELAAASDPHGPKTGVFALWSAECHISRLTFAYQDDSPVVHLVITQEHRSAVDTASSTT